MAASPNTYRIEALANGLSVLSVLVDAPVRGLTIKDIEERTGFSYNFCLRALRTLESEQFAVQTKTGWRLGPAALTLRQQ